MTAYTYCPDPATGTMRTATITGHEMLPVCDHCRYNRLVWLDEGLRRKAAELRAEMRARQRERDKAGY